MGFRCGIVGLPNVGKSTLFNALTRSGVAAENYPFCTIDPNVGVVPVPDPRLDAIATLVRPRSVVPTTMQFVDIAGLVAGASRGEGLGNQFLAHIRETQAIAHVVRCFEDADIAHVGGRIDPLGDIDTIQTELMLADLATVQRARERAAKQAKAGDPEWRRELAVLEALEAALDAGRPLAAAGLEAQAMARARALQLLTIKPVLYVANVDEAGLAGNAWTEAVARRAEAEGAGMVVVCAAIEAELAELEPAERGEFLADLGLEAPGLDRLIRAGYRLLGLATFFTAGPKECRAWTIRAGMTAVEAAGVIHSDFARGFIRAEVVAYDDFIACGGEQGAREAGRWRLEGRDYLVADGDVIHFRFNV